MVTLRDQLDLFQLVDDIITKLEEIEPNCSRQMIQCYLSQIITNIDQLREEREPQSSESQRRLRFRLSNLGSQTYLLGKTKEE